jgi:oligoendopeptidase F
MQAQRRGDFPRLRTRVGPNGMDYKGYNIAVHELGHNVEQVFSLYEVDHTLLAGVPNNAFTEALAFVFQARDLELLGQAKPDAAGERERVLNDFWQTWEIAGVALVDIAVWHWMYEHPEATPAQLREAVVGIARDTWNRYYAPVLGGQGTPLLGIYSHMISYPLYLTDYPLGHMIAFQIEEHLHEAGNLGAEFERMASQGALTPDVWMTNATGAPVSAEPLLRATEAALR